MEMPRLGKSVRRVVVLHKDDKGNFSPTVLYKGGRKKRKISGVLAPLERGIRKLTRAQVTFANTYLDKHTRSNEKRKDGWMTDFVSNVAQAGKDGRKKLRLNWVNPLR